MISHTLYRKKLERFHKKKLLLGLANSLVISKQFQRKFPIQAALHRALDGALIGALITVAIISSVALHSQYLWTEAFTRLETTRDLNRRILESTSILENHLLKNSKLSKSLVPTKAADLIYVDRPSQENKELVTETVSRKVLERISSLPVKYGY